MDSLKQCKHLCEPIIYMKILGTLNNAYNDECLGICEFILVKSLLLPTDQFLHYNHVSQANRANSHHSSK